MASIEERVATGSAWLDEHRPGWWRRIDLDTLDIVDECGCVLGQEYGSYVNAPDEIWERGLIAGGGFDAAVIGEYAALTDGWRRLIEQRRTDEPPTGDEA